MPKCARTYCIYKYAGTFRVRKKYRQTPLTAALKTTVWEMWRDDIPSLDRES